MAPLTTNETSHSKKCLRVAGIQSNDGPGCQSRNAIPVERSLLGPAPERKDKGIIDKLTKPSTPAARKQRKRLGLPLVFFTNHEAVYITACPDSGSDDNIMSLETAHEFGLPIMDIRDPLPRSFVIANGRTVSAVGQVRLKCAFGPVFSSTVLHECVFYVFPTLVVPMIMGLDFLHSTKTLSKHHYRLIEDWVPAMQALRVCSISRPKRQVVCRVGHYVGCATADTGSDMDFVSLDFVASRAFNVEESFMEVEFADGSKTYITGVIKTNFSIGSVGDVEGFIPRTQEMALELFVLNNLNADIIVGADTIQKLQAFSGHDDCFIPSMPRLGESDLNIIRYIGAVERGMFRAWEFLKDSLTPSEKKQAGMTSMPSKLVICVQDFLVLTDDIRRARSKAEMGTRA